VSAPRAVLTERRGTVLVITLNRPAASNAVDGEMARGIAAAVDRLDDDDGLRAAVIGGAGEGFCAGADPKALAGGDPPYVAGRGFAGLVEAPPEKPLVAAIEGFAMGGGLGIALACDLVVAAPGAKLGIPEVRRGLVALGGGLPSLPGRVGRGVALEMALTGAPIDARRGYEVGLVNRLADSGATLDAALELAGTVTRNAPGAVRASKRVIVESPAWPADERWLRQDEVAGPIFASEEARATTAAFGERLERLWAATDRREGAVE
jgi:enoyl-CoA hydratase